LKWRTICAPTATPLPPSATSLIARAWVLLSAQNVASGG
jgi:hypothetical protein